MSAFAIAHLRTPQINVDVLEYLDRIQATITPFSGRFRVHGPTVEVVEGNWPGSIVVIEFPDRESATGWYKSQAYQEILPLRTRHIEGDAIIVDGVPADYDPGQAASQMRQLRAD
ncbi:DUF1330 domain-containing protein [Catelliglobosispora koreensis]|uniref:DUF1330 domain-containing protein n=1 Tax=Catelliglobosispora koreensis TaxID=129052 RepID=UPI0003824A7F|nr:DUF1330 domain-containing protein [Catelliglobosispora koreensis]